MDVAAIRILQDIAATSKYVHPWRDVRALLQKRATEVVTSFAREAAGLTPCALFAEAHHPRVDLPARVAPLPAPPLATLEAPDDGCADAGVGESAGAPADAVQAVVRGLVATAIGGGPPLAAPVPSMSPRAGTLGRCSTSSSLSDAVAGAGGEHDGRGRAPTPFAPSDSPAPPARDDAFTVPPLVAERVAGICDCLEAYALGAPSTLQRLAELLAAPRRCYGSASKLLNALEALVSSGGAMQPTPLAERTLPAASHPAYTQIVPVAKPKRSHANDPAPVRDPGLLSAAAAAALDAGGQAPPRRPPVTFPSGLGKASGVIGGGASSSLGLSGSGGGALSIFAAAHAQQSFSSFGAGALSAISHLYGSDGEEDDDENEAHRSGGGAGDKEGCSSAAHTASDYSALLGGASASHAPLVSSARATALQSALQNAHAMRQSGALVLGGFDEERGLGGFGSGGGGGGSGGGWDSEPPADPPGWTTIDSASEDPSGAQPSLSGGGDGGSSGILSMLRLDLGRGARPHLQGSGGTLFGDDEGDMPMRRSNPMLLLVGDEQRGDGSGGGGSGGSPLNRDADDDIFPGVGRAWGGPAEARGTASVGVAPLWGGPTSATAWVGMSSPLSSPTRDTIDAAVRVQLREGGLDAAALSSSDSGSSSVASRKRPREEDAHGERAEW